MCDRASSGADDRIRTGDLLVGNEMLYQLSYIRWNSRSCGELS